MRALVASRLPLWQPALVAGSAVVVGGLLSADPSKTIGLVVALAAVGLALWLPVDLFVGLSLGLLATFQLSSDHPLSIGGVAVYTSDLVVVLVAMRALSPRPRRDVGWRVLDVPTRIAVGAFVWS